MQKTVLRDPLLLLNENFVHHRDLARWAAEAQKRDAQPNAKRLGERYAVGGSCAGLRGRYNLIHHTPESQPFATPLQLADGRQEPEAGSLKAGEAMRVRPS